LFGYAGPALTSTTSFRDYQRTYTYAAAQQQGTDFGLPTLVQGTQFTEADNTTTITPQQAFTYDAYGNLICYNNGNQGSWILQYDALNRLTGVGDPDDNYITNAACNKTGGLRQHTANLTSYYPNGQVSQTQTPEQFRYSVATAFTYDADGNQVTETHHHDNSAANTNKYYDGADRLIEVWLPLDNRKLPGIPDSQNLYTPDLYAIYNCPWITRYLYDLTMGGQVSVTGSTTFNAYGNLYDTTELLPNAGGSAGPVLIGPSTPSSNQYYDVKASAFDALDRPTTKFYYVPGSLLSHSSDLRSTTLTYDVSGNAGFLSTSKDAVATTTTYTYDSVGHEASITFSDSTPSRSYVYDPDGRTANVVEQPYGTLYYTFDPDGMVATVKEPTGGGVTSPENPLTYHYYPNGWKSSIDVASSNFNQNGLFSYIYRADGKRTGIIIQATGKTRNLGWNYTAAGRVTSSNDTWLNPAVTYTYAGSYGDVTTQTLQEGSFSGINYDAEESPIGIASTPYGTQQQFHTNIRGEAFQSYGTGEVDAYTADGFVVAQPPGNGTSQNSESFDPVNAVLYHFETDDVASGLCTNKIDYGFDADGRQISAVDTVGTKSGSCPSPGSGGTYSRQYDAENHLVSETLTNWICKYGGECGANDNNSIKLSGTQSNVWGPNGHPIVISEPAGASQPAAYAATLHWDGDNILYTTTNPGGAADDIRVETLAEIAPGDPGYSDLDVWDRDWNGQLVGCWQQHNSTTTPPTGPCVPPDSTFGFKPDSSQIGGSGTGGSIPTIHFMYRRTDGFADNLNVIQGTRTYSAGLQAWTTPDAYQGDVHDPMSQKPYMWNRNNPTGYQDPTGFIVAFTNDYIRRLVNAMEKASSTFAARMDTLMKDKNTYTFSAEPKAAEGTGGEYDPDSRTVSIDMSQSKGLIEGQIAHEATHAWHHSKDPTGFSARKNESAVCSGDCSKFSGPAHTSSEPYNREEQQTYKDAHPISDEDSSVTWLGPDWQGSQSMDWPSFQQFFGGQDPEIRIPL